MRRLFRRLFKPAPLPAMLDYLDGDAGVTGILCMVERGQPGGEKHEVWLVWKEPRMCLGGTVTVEPYPPETKPVALDRKELEDFLETHGFWQMHDDLGTVRDGTHYTVAFASRDRVRLVRIWNPALGSFHANFVDQLVDRMKRFGLWPNGALNGVSRKQG